MDISSGPGCITVVCTFAEGSTAQGFSVVISIEGMQDITRNASRSLEQRNVTAQISGLFIGTYSVSVFGIGEDGNVNLGNPVLETRGVDIIEPAPSTSVTLPPPSTGNTSTQDTFIHTIQLNLISMFYSYYSYNIINSDVTSHSTCYYRGAYWWS